MLIIRHGRSRVRHSSEKNHIRWGLQAFDNLTLYDYDYEGANGTNGSNETLFDFGGNQTFLGVDTFGYGDTAFNNGTYINANANDSKLGSTPAPSLVSSRWSASTSTMPAKNPKLAKKQIMESIRKNVEEGIEYLRTHAHLTQPTAVMPSEKALLQLQKQAEQLQQVNIDKLKIPINQNDESKRIASLSSVPLPISKYFKSLPSSPSSSLSVPLNQARNDHEHNQFNQKKRKSDKKLPWKTHQNDGTFDANHIDDRAFDYEMVNDEPVVPQNENAHQSDSHPYKSSKLNKSNARHAHEQSQTGSRSNSIATMKTIDSIVTSINAAVSKKFLDQAINSGNGGGSGTKPNFNVTKANLRSQSNSKTVARPQSSSSSSSTLNEMPKNTTITQSKGSEIPISSVASLMSHSIDTDISKSNDDSAALPSNAKFNKNFNNQFESNSFVSPFDELNDEQQTNDDNNDDINPFPYDPNYEQTISFDGKSINGNSDGTQLPIFRIEDMDLDDYDEISRNNRMNLKRGRDVVTKFLQIVESQHLLGANCSAGTALNLGEGVVDRYAQDRFRVEAEVAVNRANMLTR